MKIAVPSLDGIAISPHFGKSLCYLVFRVRGGEIVGKEIRMLSEHRFSGEKESWAVSRPRIHAEILTPLLDCDVVLSGGMALPVARDLEKRGVKPLVVADPGLSPEAAVEKFLAGKLELAAIEGECCQEVPCPQGGRGYE
jgi:predicted Fe-Mo cluster-binding NifX family protein